MPLAIETPVPCKADVPPLSLTPNAAIYSLQLTSSIVNGRLMVSGAFVFQRAQFDLETQSWVADPRADATGSESFGDIAQWLNDNPSLATAALALWEQIDAFANALNQAKQIV